MINYVSIDFSLNAPGICIWREDQNCYYFLSYINSSKVTKKELKFHEEINQNFDTEIRYQPKHYSNNNNFSDNERLKINRFDILSSELIKLITEYTLQQNNYIIAFEGVSYNSSNTNNLVDMAGAIAILKSKMQKELPIESMQTVSPNTIKKWAGKGNMNKNQMFEQFRYNNSDYILTNQPLWHIVSHYEFGNKIYKPIDDFIDAYYLVNGISTNL